MPDAFAALLTRHWTPKLLNSFNQLVLCLGLHFSSNILLQFMPQVLYGVQVWWFWGCLPYLILFQECFAQLGHMLRIIILEYHDSLILAILWLFNVNLHKSVLLWGWENLTYKWNQCLLQDVDIHWGVHYSFKNADSGSAMHAYTCTFTGCFALHNKEESKHYNHYKVISANSGVCYVAVFTWACS